MAVNDASGAAPQAGADSDSLIVYPSAFPIKVMGPAAPGFETAVVAVVRRHAPDFDPATVEIRSSREGKYASLTATVTATSREQLDALYKELCDHPMVVMVL
jgi:putative lipoic acid-binding regulatory protein